MAGTINLSLSQQLDQYGKPLDGGLLYFIKAGTTATPQNAFQDVALAIPYPNPIALDAAGRVPPFYLADGQIKIRLTDKSGVLQLIADNLLVIGPSAGGGGGGGGVDVTTLNQTGFVVLRYGAGALAGFVRMNGGYIGPTTAATPPSVWVERLNSADCQPLFEYLWNADPTLAVYPSRGATSIADWTGNKSLKLPDGRSRLLAGLADMGNVASTLLNGCVFTTGNSTTLGSSYGAGRWQLVTGNLPPYTPAGAVSGSFAGGGSGSGSGGVTGSASVNVTGNIAGLANLKANVFNTFAPGGGGLVVPSNNAANNSPYSEPVTGTFNGTGSGAITGTANVNVTVNVSGGISAAFAGTAQGGNATPFDLNAPTLLLTYYIKL